MQSLVQRGQPPRQRAGLKTELTVSYSTMSPDLRPELIATVLRIDGADPEYAALSGLAHRVAVLLAESSGHSDPNVESSLDDLLGAIYALILARHHRFADRTDQPIELKAVRQRAEDVARGDVRVDGKWIAGWYFNSALFRVAAVYHRLLKIVGGDPKTREYVSTLKEKIQQTYRTWTSTDWSNANADRIYAEVNTLKHTPHGVHYRRTATFREAVEALGELLTLVEAWTQSR